MKQRITEVWHDDKVHQHVVVVVNAVAIEVRAETHLVAFATGVERETLQLVHPALPRSRLSLTQHASRINKQNNTFYMSNNSTLF